MEQLSGLGGIIDAPSEEIADGLVEELKDRGVVTVGNIDKLTDGTIFMDVNLSLDGWEKYAGRRRRKNAVVSMETTDSSP